MEANSKNLPSIIIFGRPNVGKSTLFNRLMEKNQALVSKIEGTTRDSNIGQIEWRGVKIKLVDTGGILNLKYLTDKKMKAGDIDAEVQKKVRQHLKEADLILFLVDAKTGLLPPDKQMAMFLKKRRAWLKNSLLVANKCDSEKNRLNIHEFNKLSLGEPIPVSAANGSGTGDLLDIVIKKIRGKKTKLPSLSEEPVPPARLPGGSLSREEGPGEVIRVSIIGKPNVGKSSLLNKILGYNRVIVSPAPHTTREPQNTEMTYKNHLITLIDTAGISRKGTKTDGLEKYGVLKSLAALKKSDIALLVIDINEGITHQDAKLVEEIMDRRASFIIIANKWDMIEEKDVKKYTNYIYAEFPFCVWAPAHFASALTGSKVDKILDLILNLSEQRKIQLSDSQLDKFLSKIVKIHKPAKAYGTKRPHIYEITQIKSNPPAFKVRIGAKDSLADSYARFIENQLRRKYGFTGAPIAIYVEKNKQIHGKHERLSKS